MPEMCDRCAFRRGCETWHEPRNRLISQICAAGPLPFFCHVNLDWKNPLSHLLPVKALAASAAPAGGLRVCEGWKRAVAARQWPEDSILRWYQRSLAKSALATAQRFLDGDASGRELQRDVRALAGFYRGPRVWQIERMPNAKP